MNRSARSARARSEQARSVEYFVPPHIVEAIRLRGDTAQRKMADQMERLATEMRAERLAAEPATSYLAAPVLAATAVAGPQRKVYDAKRKTTLPGTFVRGEGDPASGDPAADNAYDHAGTVYGLYSEHFGRDSLDGSGMDVVSSVHYRKEYNNAFWNGTQMAYGDGDGVIFQTFMRLSVVGHELSHGVVQFSGGLVYRDQSGALNESFADVFGCLAVQYEAGQTAAEANWLVGDGVLGPDIHGDALRSMKAPGTAYDDPLLGKDPQPYHMSGYVATSSDNGGVHINSGIPNHAFYLLASYLGGHAWERAGRIWYDALQSIQNPQATFQDWADMTVAKARERYKSGSREYLFTRRAWKLVGIDT